MHGDVLETTPAQNHTAFKTPCAQLIKPLTYLEDPTHDRTHDHRRAFRKPANELVQEVFRRDLQMQWVATVRNESLQKLNWEQD